MSPFVKQDQIGRDRTTMLFPKLDLTESPERYSVWDMSGMTQNVAGDITPFLMEIKDRDIESTTFNTAFIEFKKYQALKVLAAINNIQDIFYINHYTDKVAYVFNLKNYNIYNLQLTIRKSKETTMGATTLVDKIFVELPIQQGKKYKNK